MEVYLYKGWAPLPHGPPHATLAFRLQFLSLVTRIKRFSAVTVQNNDIKIGALLSLLLALFCGSTFASTKLLPRECRTEKNTPYKIRGSVLSVTATSTYVAMKVKVSSKVNLCTGQKQRVPASVETVSFGGDAKFMDKYGVIKSPSKLLSHDRVVATGYYGPLVYPANCPANKNCFNRGMVLFQQNHQLVRR